jgi:C-terminal processing protease CtpA/Prc
MNIKYITIAAAMSATFFFTGCDYQEKDDVIVSRRSKEALERQENNKDYTVWEFIHSTSKVYYLWQDNVPGYDIQYSNYKTPEDFFESFRHEDDRFSAVLNNYTETEEGFSNVYMTDGINYMLYKESNNNDNLFGVVDYVYDNSPAKEAGIKRGYVIHKVNGTQLTMDNYNTLLGLPSCKYTYSIFTEEEQNGKPMLIYGDDPQESPEITKIHMDIDPVLQTKVFNKNGRKIGYLLYDAFTDDDKTITKAIEKLEAQQIDDLVLDLRINGGGYLITLGTIASMLVPDGHEDDVFIKETFNKTLDREYREWQGKDYNVTRFSKVNHKLNLGRLYVLTSRNTASASEELIAGLQPYMPVILIGDRTYGKFTSNYLLNDTIDVGNDPDGIPYKEWALYICVASCTNANGEMNFKNGFTPDYDIIDTYQHELGDEQEPLLAKAFELCAGSLAKSQKMQPEPLKGYVGSYGKPIDRYGLISNK